MRTEKVTIPTNTAMIQERQVSIQVLTIGTKQVTQSLYKQLVEAQVIGKDLILNGHIWGWVNLHADCKNEEHLHVIWESNDQLKRSCVTRQCPLKEYHDMKWCLERLGKIYLCKRVHEDDEFRSRVISSSKRYRDTTCYSATLTLSGQKLYAQVSASYSSATNPDFIYAAKKIIDETHWCGQQFDFTSHSSIYGQMEQLAIKVTNI